MSRRARALLAGLALAHAAAGLAFAFLNQPGNAPDEPAHAAYVKYWAASGEVPAFERSPYWPRYTAHHPPYYFAFLRMAYPFVRHAPIETQFRLFRALSVLFHALAAAFVFLAALEFFKGDDLAAAGAAALIVFNPMFAFMGAAVNNEALANMAAALLVWLSLRRLRRGAAPAAWLIGSAAGLAAGAKTSVVIPAIAVLVYLRWSKRFSARDLLAAGAFFLLIAGPVLARNVALYGDPFAAAALYKTEPTAAGLAGLPAWVAGSYRSYWAVFGWMTVSVPAFFYAGLWALGGAAAAGLAGALARTDVRRDEAMRFLLFFGALVLAQAAWYGAITIQAQGRYLFIGAAAFSILAFRGLSFWMQLLPRPARAAAWGALVLFAGALWWTSLSRVASSFNTIPGVHNPKGV